MKIIITESQLLRIQKDIDNNTINECVIVGVRLDNGIVLAKNRDRGYKAKIEIIHEIIDGVEVLYWLDVDTDWSEGMNEFGVGVVNSSLAVKEDEKEGKEVESTRKNDATERKNKAHNGKKIRKALTHKTLPKVIKSIVSYVGEDKNDVGLKGETIVSDNKNIYIIEMTPVHSPVITKLKEDSKFVVRTNHGIHQKSAGYTNGVKRKSSVSRLNLVKDNLKKVKTDKDVIDVMKKKYKNDPFLNPYRTKNKFNMHTTGQIMLNLDKKEVTVRMDNEFGEIVGLKNKLPKDYKPKIKLKIYRSKKNLS